MSSRQSAGSSVRDLRLTRVALGVLAVGSASIGLPATLAPRGFYDGYPFVAHWVDRLPPFNEHLVTDVGGLFLAFAVLFTWATIRPRRELVVPLAVAWSVSALLHLVFHARHLDGFTVADAIGELVSLAVLLVLPAIAVWALPRETAGPGPIQRESARRLAQLGGTEPDRNEIPRRQTPPQ